MKIPVLALLLALPLAAQDLPSIRSMKSAAETFLGSLDDAKRAKASFPFTDASRENYRYTPRERTGLPLKEMNEVQSAAAMKLLDAALSEKGLLMATQIMSLEDVLAEIEKRPEFRDSKKYFLSIFGTPGDEAAWGWKFEGHHVSLNYTIANNKDLSVTPSFFGSNPAEVRVGERKVLRVIKAEDELAHALLASLLAAGNKAVVFSDKAPAEILTGENREATALDPAGVAAADMTEAQKNSLMELLSVYTGRHIKPLADAYMRKIQSGGIDKIRFGWAGGTQPGEPWYYRIQGPAFLIEAANTQNQANHIHTVWREFHGDFGRDVLAEHYRQHP